MNMKYQTSKTDPVRSIGIAFMICMFILTLIMLWASGNGSTDIRSRAAIIPGPLTTCLNSGVCMTANRCGSTRGYILGPLDCRGSNICCSKYPPTTNLPTPTPFP